MTRYKMSAPTVTPTSHIRGHQCSECQNEIYANAITCSATCRKRRERRLKMQHSAYIVVLREMQNMRDGIKRGENLENFRNQLQRIKDEVSDLQFLARDDDALSRREMLEDRARRMGNL